jgi:hypothetical protein
MKALQRNIKQSFARRDLRTRVRRSRSWSERWSSHERGVGRLWSFSWSVTTAWSIRMQREHMG